MAIATIGVRTADFNGDGRLDLAGTNSTNSVSVLLGNGDGSFQPAITYSAGNGFRTVAAADFNGDCKLDLVVTTYYSVSVLLGNGDGSFQAEPSFNTGGAPGSVAVGDFNGDGIPDLAVANYNGTVSVLLGNGDGSFQPAITFAARLGSASVVVGDFNGDGIPDLATAGALGVSVLLGNGDGSFQPARTFVDDNANSVAVGDFNGDGKLDLVTANYTEQCDLYGCTTIASDVTVLLGNGDSSFQPARTFPAGSGPRSVAVGDFNGDGKLDLVTANYGMLRDFDGCRITESDVTVLLGNGDGSFGSARSFSNGIYSFVTVSDINSDGIPDLITNDSVWLGNGDGSFQFSHYLRFRGSSLAVGDFNGDGIPDLAVIADNVRVLLGNGDGSFQTTNVSYIVGNRPQALAVGDFNGDGWPDLVTANSVSNDVSIPLNDGTWPSAGRVRSRGNLPKLRTPPASPDLLASAELRFDSNAAPCCHGRLCPSPMAASQPSASTRTRACPSPLSPKRAPRHPEYRSRSGLGWWRQRGRCWIASLPNPRAAGSGTLPPISRGGRSSNPWTDDELIRRQVFGDSFPSILPASGLRARDDVLVLQTAFGGASHRDPPRTKR